MSDGRVAELEVSLRDAVTGHERRWHHVNTVQNAMSNSLSSIGQTDECLTRLKQDLDAEDYVLEQLAIVGSLLHKDSACSIQCIITASIDNSSLPYCRRITASLSNRAKFSLGRRLVFLMSASPSSFCSCSDHVAAGNRCKSCRTDSRSLYSSCDVSELSPGSSETLSLLIPLDDQSFTEVSRVVETALIYTLVNRENTATKQVSVPLTSQVFDVLDFVQLASLQPGRLYSSRGGGFVTECDRLQQLCRPQIRDASDSASVNKLESHNKSDESVKEHAISVCASKQSNATGAVIGFFFKI